MPKRLHVDGGTHLSLCSQNHSVYIYTHTSLLVLFSVMNSSNFEIYGVGNKFRIVCALKQL